MHSNDVVAKDAHTLDYIRHLKDYLKTVITEAHRIKGLIAANEAVLSQNFEMGGQIQQGDGDLKPDETRTLELTRDESRVLELVVSEALAA